MDCIQGSRRFEGLLYKHGIEDMEVDCNYKH